MTGEQIRKQRQAMGFTLKELSNLVGVSVSTLHRIEKGNFKKYSPSLFKSISDVLGIDFEVKSEIELNTIGQRISTLRRDLGLSIDDLAALICKNRATIYRYEIETSESIPCSAILPLCKALNTTPNYLLGWEENEQCNLKK